jgi:putative transposase
MDAMKCYKFRLKPTAEQEALFVQFAGCRRFVWNWALARKTAVYKETGKGINYNALAGELVALKKQPETAFLKESHSQVLQQTLMDLDKAFGAFFDKRARFPRFKSRKRSPHAFRFPQNVTIDGNSISVPKVGRVKAIIHRPTEGVLKSATIKQEAGAWYVVFVSHVTLPDVPVSCANPVGIDVGLESFVTLSDGEKVGYPLKVGAPKFYRKAERKIARLSRQVSRCEKQSKRWQKARARLARFHATVANRRNDWLHKLSARLVSEHDTICIEDLNIKGLVKTKLAKSFHDAALSTFLRQLEYKAQWNCGQVVKVGRFFPSSKTCHECGARVKLSLSDREWLCGACGVLHDRDINAAVNILKEGLCISRLAPSCLHDAATPPKLYSLAGGTLDSLNALGAGVSPVNTGNLR